MIEKVFLGFIYDLINKTYPIKFKLPSEEADIFGLIKESINFLAETNNLELESTEGLKVFVNFLEEKVVPEIDKIPATFFVDSVKNKRDFLQKNISHSGLMWNVLCNLLTTCSFEELQSELSNLVLRVYPNRFSLLIQSARECEPKLKLEIRSYNKDKFYVSFQIQKSLLGGMRVYANSVLQDASWLGRISLLKSI